MPAPCPIEYEGNLYKSLSMQRKISVIMLKNICDEYKIGYKDIIGRDRRQALVYFRAMIARRLLNIGFSMTTVGYAMGKDHTTIFHYKSKKYDYLGVMLDA